MGDETEGDSALAPCRVGVAHLDDQQLRLLRAVLRGGDVPFGIIRGEVVAGQEHAEEIEKAVGWVLAGAEQPLEAEIDDPDYHSGKAPLVPPPRPPLPDGRHLATRWRRLSAGIMDEVIVGLPTALATRAGAALWTVAAIHAVYYIGPTTMYGWSVGKYWCGLRVVERRTLLPPSITRAAVRWFVAYVPLLIGSLAGLSANWVTAGLAVVYAPIVLDLRGLHDRAAGTVVAERSPSGPGVLVRKPRSAKLPG